MMKFLGMLFVVYFSVNTFASHTTVKDAPLNYLFSNMTTNTVDLGGKYVQVYVVYGSDGIATGEACEFRFYDDAYALVPFESYLSTNKLSTTRISLRYKTNASAFNNWRANLCGRLEIEALSGSVSIASVEFTVVDLTDNMYQETILQPSTLIQTTTLGTPVSWLQNLGYTGDWDTADVADPDDDNFLNWQEYVADTLALDGADFLKINIREGNISFDSSTSCVYAVDCTHNMSEPNWIEYTNNVIGTGNQILLPSCGATNEAFFQLHVERIP